MTNFKRLENGYTFKELEIIPGWWILYNFNDIEKEMEFCTSIYIPYHLINNSVLNVLKRKGFQEAALTHTDDRENNRYDSRIGDFYTYVYDFSSIIHAVYPETNYEDNVKEFFETIDSHNSDDSDNADKSESDILEQNYI